MKKYQECHLYCIKCDEDTLDWSIGSNQFIECKECGKPLNLVTIDEP